jgi:hypothetical protein
MVHPLFQKKLPAQWAGTREQQSPHSGEEIVPEAVRQDGKNLKGYLVSAGLMEAGL